MDPRHLADEAAQLAALAEQVATDAEQLADQESADLAGSGDLSATGDTSVPLPPPPSPADLVLTGVSW